MSGETCPRCHRWHFRRCDCQLFQCGQPWRGGVEEHSWRDVYATDAEQAAERYCEESDCDGDYTIIRNGSAEVWVRNVVNEVTKFNVEAESVPTYTAHEAKADTTSDQREGT